LRRLVLALLFLVSLTPVFGAKVALVVRSKDSSDLAVALEQVVRTACIKSFGTLVQIEEQGEEQLTVSITDIKEDSRIISCQVTIGYGGSTLDEQLVVAHTSSWQNSLMTLLVDQLRYDALSLFPPVGSVYITSNYGHTYTSDSKALQWKEGNIYGAYSSSGKLTGTLVVRSIRPEAVLFDTLSDTSLRVGQSLSRRKGQSLEMAGLYLYTDNSFGFSADYQLSCWYPLYFSAGLSYFNSNLIMEAGGGTFLSLSTLSDLYFLRNSFFTMTVRFGLGIDPFVIGSSASLAYHFQMTPCLLLSLSARMLYYANIETKSTWYNGYQFSLGAGYQW